MGKLLNAFVIKDCRTSYNRLTNALILAYTLPTSPLARWQNGYAEDCKSLYAGSIPARASIYLFADVLHRTQTFK